MTNGKCVSEILFHKRALDPRLKCHQALKLSSAIFITSPNKTDQPRSYFFNNWKSNVENIQLILEQVEHK